MNDPKNLSLRDSLLLKIYAYAGSIWIEKWEKGIDAIWLDNFKNGDDDTVEREQVNMLYLLSKFMFFGNKELRQLLFSIYRDLYKYPIVASIRKNNKDTTDIRFIEEKFEEELNATRFLGVGNPSESGVHLLYYFRQECGLSKEHFINAGEIFSSKTIIERLESLRKLFSFIPFGFMKKKRIYLKSSIANQNINRYVFIDDFCGTGSQASGYLKGLVLNLKTENPKLIVNYFMLFGTETGISNIRKLGIFDDVQAVYTIDDSFKAFSDVSRYFDAVPDPQIIERIFSKQTAEKYGVALFDPALGFGESQLLLGLFHNTPDNTLPIFWSETGGWKPIFKRYNKIYYI